MVTPPGQGQRGDPAFVELSSPDSLIFAGYQSIGPVCPVPTHTGAGTGPWRRPRHPFIVSLRKSKSHLELGALLQPGIWGDGGGSGGGVCVGGVVWEGCKTGPSGPSTSLPSRSSCTQSGPAEAQQPRLSPSALGDLLLILGPTGCTPHLRIPEHQTRLSGPSGSHSPLCR